MESDLPNECFECGTPCGGDICHECEALQQYDFEHEADDPPEGWYDGWASYTKEYD